MSGLSDTIISADKKIESYNVSFSAERFPAGATVTIEETVRYYGLSLKAVKEDSFNDSVTPPVTEIGLLGVVDGPVLSQSYNTRSTMVVTQASGYELIRDYRTSLFYPGGTGDGTNFVSVSPSGGKNFSYPISVTLTRVGSFGNRIRYHVIPLYHENFADRFGGVSTQSSVSISLTFPCLLVAYISLDFTLLKADPTVLFFR